MHLGFLIKQGLFDKFVETGEEKKEWLICSWKIGLEYPLGRMGLEYPREWEIILTQKDFQILIILEKRDWSIPLERRGWYILVDDMI